MQDLIYIFSFQDDALNVVFLAAILLGISSGVVGVFTVLNHKALVVDAIAHSVLPGICLGFMLSGTKDFFWLISGGVVFGVVSVWLINFVVRFGKVNTGSAIALVLSSLFALGVIMLNVIQKSGNSAQSGLNDFLFGKASAVLLSDLKMFTLFFIFILFLSTLFYKSFKVYLFDKLFAKTIGFSSNWIQVILSTCIILLTAIGVQSVGVVLMSAMIVGPAATALLWGKKLHQVIFIAAFAGAFAGFTGMSLSYIYPWMPSGPAIIICLSALSFFSLLFSPKKGWIYNLFIQYAHRKSILRDNVLKTIFVSTDSSIGLSKVISVEQLFRIKSFTKAQLKKALSILKRQSYVIQQQNSYQLTKKGEAEARRIFRLHNLWELYLQHYMNLTKEHFHESADRIEHVITPEVEEELLQLLVNFGLKTECENKTAD